jgi:hypothetical protein
METYHQVGMTNNFGADNKQTENERSRYERKT